jgi:hypothetical protein
LAAALVACEPGDATRVAGEHPSARHDLVAPYGCLDVVGAGEWDYACRHPSLGFTEFHVTVSEDCARGGCGLILDVHGGRMDWFAQDAASGMRVHGAERGFIVVQPTAAYPASDSAWGMRVWLWADPYATSEIATVHDFVQDAIVAYAIDEEAVHVTGFSQGGWMTWQQLCYYPETYASGAPVGFGQSAGFNPSFPPTLNCFEQDGPALERAVLWVHGTDDFRVPYDPFAAPLLENIIDIWGLELEDEACYGGDDDDDDDGEDCPRGTVSTYESAEGTELVHITHPLVTDAPDEVYNGMGHCYPGVGYPSVGGTPDIENTLDFWSWILGCGVDTPEDQGIEPLGKTIVDFFEDHDRDDGDDDDDDDDDNEDDDD